MKLILVLLAILIASSQQRFFNNPKVNNLAYDQEDEDQYDGEVYWFKEQILDHFKLGPAEHWSQRYIVQDYYFDKQNGPLFLYIGGESYAHAVSKKSNFTLCLAEEFKGIVITLEHRFYGSSQPYGQGPDSYSVENMKMLTHEQALDDLATFIGYLKQNKLFGIKEDTPVITIGGSYPGALSAWFRYKYKHLTIGALASSAVVNAIEDYQEFDTQIRLSAASQGEECVDNIRELTQYAQSVLDREDGEAQIQNFKAQFGAQQLSKVDFLYFFADIFALQVQYGKTTDVCEMISGPFDQALANIQKYARDNCNPNDYDQEKMKETQYSYTKNIRQWTYQTCTYVGWFYSAAFYKPMRSTLVDVKYFQDLCENIYGKGYLPKVQDTNTIMGGTKMRTENIIFTNGGQDPWKWASILQDKGDMKAIVIDCVDCAHCVDLSSPKEGEPQVLSQARKDIIENMRTWISQYCQYQTLIQY
ncbi:hypothetical protein PPERSA_06930 [Pseudocohnilembus persalinus]|uniref:Peptidase S28 n=1 Tax=Pseudocohnilembus persalinus TaxID=266149 RepID=A0A0V0QY84_PSEPJ|nr:hypothetical protein PPERSA_06930 [Pseudocohnilembus persalinus]|eukprot:KRX07315.1 hypothetical protein PPERSA_06930 [Pseudocohnilembus persalinus]